MGGPLIVAYIQWAGDIERGQTISVKVREPEVEHTVAVARHERVIAGRYGPQRGAHANCSGGICVNRIA
jgi:hypothetical protein